MNDREWLQSAIDLSRKCPPWDKAFSVGAVVVDAHSREIAHGYSRETDLHVHAEESALRKLDPGDARLHEATLYSSMEPCSKRKSRPRSCTALILQAGIPRVVFALREPGVFVNGSGAEELAAAGVEVVEFPEMAPGALDVNRHLIKPPDS